MAYAQATFTGNLTRDPEVRQVGDDPVASFGVAENRKFGEKETTHFFEVSCWGTLAENVAESLRRGDRVIVWGSPEFRSWEDNDGNKRNAIQFRAEAVGPDLRWATAQIEKNEKKEPVSNGRSSPGGSRTAPARQASRTQPPAQEYDYDSEPF